MKARKAWFLALTAIIAVLFVAGAAMAAQGQGRKGKGGKGRKAQEAAAQAEQSAAEEAAPAETATRAEVNAESTGSAQAAGKPTLEGRLRALQTAVEAATTKNQHKVPRTINDLVKFIPEGKKGLVNPESGKPLQMNQSMAAQDEVTIKNPEQFITFYAGEDTPGKGRAVIYATGDIKYLSADEFQKALDASKIVKLSRDERLNLQAQRMDAMADERDARSMAREERMRTGKKAKKGKQQSGE